MTPLHDLVIKRLQAMGPMPLSDYMAECLLHPEHGYYTQSQPFGARGDFTTAPEISQMFGELIGLWVAQAWIDQGAPSAFVLAEIGPGRGTLMADLLRATRAVPGFHAAMEVHLIEASPRLRARQAEALAGFAPIWHDHIEELPQAPLFLVANEFYDALPLRQFTRQGAGWCETLVTAQGDRLALAKSRPLPLAELSHRLGDTKDGDIVEICPAAAPITDSLAQRIAQNGGAALIVDYGDWHSRGDTVQAMRAHAYVDILDHPGQADLTGHVDFEPLAQAAVAAGAKPYGPITQGDLLERLGIHTRSEHLARNLSGQQLAVHLAATRRLTHPEEMGRLFKALAILPPNAPLPAGFDPCP